MQANKAQYKAYIDQLKQIWKQPLADVVTDINPTRPTISENTKTAIELVATDTISAAVAEHNKDTGKRICILNFASYKTPGGGFLGGSLAQEEAICHCTNLYPHLLENWEWYENHKNTKHYGAYTNECLVSHNVTVIADMPGNYIKESDRFTIDVITCAAPNWTSILRYDADNTAMLNKMIQASFNRVQYVMRTLSGYEYDTIILGAFGCGAFRNDPEVVAEAFYYSLTELLPNVFNRVVFAIPDENSKNYRVFANQFADLTQPCELKTSIF